jgi:GNAT superfamily N-acetyltransferase
VIQIRPARRADAALILGFIRELAEYERLAHEVAATPADLERSLFGDPPYAHALIAETAGEAVGFAVYFFNFSTFLGRPGLYLEDLFVRPTSRGQGVGRALLQQLAAIALERGCGRLEWAVLDWNEPAIRFYRSLGARANDDWTIYRVAGEALARLAGGA